MADPSIIVALVSGLVSGGGVAILNYFLNRKQTKANLEKTKAETDKIQAEIKNLSASLAYNSSEQIIFDGSTKIDGFDVTGASGKFWTGIGKDAKAISLEGHGNLSFGEEGILNVQRTDTQGRYEIRLKRYIYSGKEYPAIPVDELISGKRKIRISGEAKAVGGEHTLRFVARIKKTGQRLSEETVKVNRNDWLPFQVYLEADPAQECELRIDDEQVSVAPSSVQIRKLVVAERKA